MPLGNALPYGLREVQLIKYPTLAATTFGTTLAKLPVARTMSFNDTEDYEDLRGDDALQTSHGQGASVEWELESGGVNFDTYAILAGGVVIDSGISPNQVRRFRKKSLDVRPFFIAIGRAINDNGGDFMPIIWRCRSTGNVEGELGDGEFYIPSVSGKGFPCLVTGLVGGQEVNDSVYDFLYRETAAAITAPALDTPAAPVVYSISDSGGTTTGGEIVVVTGYGFTGATAVTVGGTAATDWQVDNNQQVTLITPAHAAGAANIVITTPAGANGAGAQSTYTYV